MVNANELNLAEWLAVQERTRKEETARLFESVNKLRDESCERLDDIGDRTFNLRKEVGARR